MGVLKVRGPPSALNSFKVFFFLISLTGTLELLVLLLLVWDEVPLSPLAPESPVTDKVADRWVLTVRHGPTNAGTCPDSLVVVTNASVVSVVAAPQTRNVTNGTNLIWCCLMLSTLSGGSVTANSWWIKYRYRCWHSNIPLVL